MEESGSLLSNFICRMSSQDTCLIGDSQLYDCRVVTINKFDLVRICVLDGDNAVIRNRRKDLYTVVIVKGCEQVNKGECLINLVVMDLLGYPVEVIFEEVSNYVLENHYSRSNIFKQLPTVIELEIEMRKSNASNKGVAKLKNILNHVNSGQIIVSLNQKLILGKQEILLEYATITGAKIEYSENGSREKTMKALTMTNVNEAKFLKYRNSQEFDMLFHSFVISKKSTSFKITIKDNHTSIADTRLFKSFLALTITEEPAYEATNRIELQYFFHESSSSKGLITIISDDILLTTKVVEKWAILKFIFIKQLNISVLRDLETIKNEIERVVKLQVPILLVLQNCDEFKELYNSELKFDQTKAENIWREIKLLLYFSNDFHVVFHFLKSPSRDCPIENLSTSSIELKPLNLDEKIDFISRCIERKIKVHSIYNNIKEILKLSKLEINKYTLGFKMIDLENAIDKMFGVIGKEFSFDIDEFIESCGKISNLLPKDGILNMGSMPSVKWEDVGGLEKAKELVYDTIQLPMRYPNLFKSMYFIIMKIL